MELLLVASNRILEKLAKTQSILRLKLSGLWAGIC